MLERLWNWLSPPDAALAGFKPVHYDGDILTFRARNRLPVKAEVPLALRLANDESEVATLRLLTRGLPRWGERTYTARVEASPRARRRLLELYSVPGDVDLSDRRSYPRLVHHLRVVSQHLPNYQGLTEDVSVSGLKLLVEGELRPGETLPLQIQFDQEKYADLVLRAEVVWCRPRDGKHWAAGVRFPDVPLHARRVLGAFLEDLTAARIPGLRPQQAF